MRTHKGLKILILGLDGATFDVMDPLFEKGQLPNLRSLMKEGAWGKLRSTIPNMSAPAWGAFMTGKNPGKLGVYDFYTYDPTKYSFFEPSLITSAPLAGQTLWDILGGLDYRVGVITVPVTYPPWEVNGFMVSGYPCPDTHRNYTFPGQLADVISECCNFRADLGRTASPEEIADVGYEMMSTRTSLALRLLKERPCDLLCLVLGATDMAQHLFWRYSAPVAPEHNPDQGQYGDMIPKIYRRADDCLGRLLRETTENTLVFVLSDHGGGPAPTKEVNTNYWLRDQGLLRTGRTRQMVSSVQRSGLRFLKRTIRRWSKARAILPQAMRHRVRQVSFNVASVVWSATQVYRFPMSPPAEGLVINMVGRQPQGVVRPGQEYESLRTSLIERILQLRDPETGEPIVEKVFRREELYNGEHLGRAPDLVVLFKSAYMGGNGLDAPLLTPHRIGHINGQHSLDGILMATGRGIKRDYHLLSAHILDVTPTILYALDAPIPRDMDGKVLQDIFEESFLEDRPIRYGEPLGPSRAPEKDLTAEEQESMREKLRSLGYLS